MFRPNMLPPFSGQKKTSDADVGREVGEECKCDAEGSGEELGEIGLGRYEELANGGDEKEE